MMLLEWFSVDTSVFSTDVMSFHDDSFCRLAGMSEVILLKVQGTRFVYSFLNTEDVFDILTIQCCALNNIRRVICLETADHTFIMKLGCRSIIFNISTTFSTGNMKNI